MAHAVRLFQRAAGLEMDGVVGPSTLRALRRRTLTRGGSPSGPVRFLRPVDAPIGDRFGAPAPAGEGTPGSTCWPATARRWARGFACRPNADAWGSRDADPAFARIDRCP